MPDYRARNYENNRSRVYDYDEFVRRSTRGEVAKSAPKRRNVSRERYERLREEFNKKLKRCIIAGVVAGAILISGGGYVINDVIPNAVNNHQVSSEIGHNIGSFRDQYITPNTHRTDDYQHYFYDYYNIYQGLSEYGDGDFDLNLFYCLEGLGSRYTSDVLDCSDKYRLYVAVGTDEYGDDILETRSLRNYLYQNGFYEEGDQMLNDKAYEKALKNYENYMRDRLVILDRINDMSDENSKNMNELNDDLFVMDQEYNVYNSKGGK